MLHWLVFYHSKFHNFPKKLLAILLSFFTSENTGLPNGYTGAGFIPGAGIYRRAQYGVLDPSSHTPPQGTKYRAPLLEQNKESLAIDYLVFLTLIEGENTSQT